MILAYKHSMRVEERLLCRSVTNHSDNVLLKMSPSEDKEQVFITKHPNQEPEEPDSTSINSTQASCSLKFEVTNLSGRYYWRCLSASTGLPVGVGTVIIRMDGPCWSATWCANTFRNLKVGPTCVTVRNATEFPSASAVTSDPSWMKMQNNRAGRAGVAVCSPPGWNHAERAAVEYFFEAKDKSVQPKARRKLRA